MQRWSLGWVASRTLRPPQTLVSKFSSAAVCHTLLRQGAAGFFRTCDGVTGVEVLLGLGVDSPIHAVQEHVLRALGNTLYPIPVGAQ